jgi:transcriptional regulator with XRE-family HTH domain
VGQCVPYPVSTRVERELRRNGAGIQTARLRRNMSQEDLGERIGASFHTVRAIEQGKASTAFGYYVHALWVLGLFETLSQVADPALDAEGIALEAGEPHAG